MLYSPAATSLAAAATGPYAQFVDGQEGLLTEPPEFRTRTVASSPNLGRFSPPLPVAGVDAATASPRSSSTSSRMWLSDGIRSQLGDYGRGEQARVAAQ